MSAIATKAKSKATTKAKAAGADKSRTKKLIIGCVGVLVLGYAGSSLMAKSATSKPPPKLSAKVGATAGAASGAATTGGVTGAGITTDAAPAGQPAAGATTVTTTPWVPSPRNPFVTVPSDK